MLEVYRSLQETEMFLFSDEGVVSFLRLSRDAVQYLSPAPFLCDAEKTQLGVHTIYTSSTLTYMCYHASL